MNKPTSTVTFCLDPSVMEATLKVIQCLCEKGMPLPEIQFEAFTWKKGNVVHTVMLPKLYAKSEP